MSDYIPGRKLTNNKQELELFNHARKLAGLPPLPEDDEATKELVQLHNVYQLFGMKGPLK
jgi:hypothetical protein